MASKTSRSLAQACNAVIRTRGSAHFSTSAAVPSRIWNNLAPSRPAVGVSATSANLQLRRPCLMFEQLITSRSFSADTESKPPSSDKGYFDKLVKNKKIVVFMKGVPEEPRCGFSNAVVQILRMHGVTKYDSHNVLENDTIRQGIKEYTNWPTIPQIFINGEFIGGCDILIEMHKSGELVEQLEKVGIKSALLEPDEFKGKDADGKK